jgi:hypothetical protein
MANTQISMKHLQISKANSSMVIVIAVASFVIAFSLVATRALLSQRAYQGRVIAEKQKAVKQLEANTKAVSSLAASYNGFISSTANVLGGNPAGTAANDGDNAKIILDALPSVYDFPALTNSIEKILRDNNYGLEAITGTDDEVNQTDAKSPNPAPIEMPFTVTATTNFQSLEGMLKLFERSIRPMQVQIVDLTGSDSDIRAVVTVKTYYQPAKSLNVIKKEVK